MNVESIAFCVHTFQEDIDELVEVMYGGAHVVEAYLWAHIVSYPIMIASFLKETALA